MPTYDQYRLTTRGRRFRMQFDNREEDKAGDPSVYTIIDMVDSGAGIRIPSSLMKTVSHMVKLNLIDKIKY